MRRGQQHPSAVCCYCSSIQATCRDAARRSAPAVCFRTRFDRHPHVYRPLYPDATALALIVDDSDEELIEKLSSRRKEKLVQERSVERDFARTEGFVNKV